MDDYSTLKQHHRRIRKLSEQFEGLSARVKTIEHNTVRSQQQIAAQVTEQARKLTSLESQVAYLQGRLRIDPETLGDHKKTS